MSRFYADETRTARAVGFKTKLLDSADHVGFGRVLRDQAIRVIVMQRKNYVKQTISHLNAARLQAAIGEWNLCAGMVQEGPFTVDPETFVSVFREFEYLHRALETYVDYLPALHLDYADLLQKPNDWFQCVLRFLNLEPHPFETSISKNTPDNFRTIVRNLDDLSTRFRETPHEWMFDEIVA